MGGKWTIEENPGPNGFDDWLEDVELVTSSPFTRDELRSLTWFGRIIWNAAQKSEESVDTTHNNASTKPWLKANEYGELPGDICCQRAAGKYCYEHNPANYNL